MAGIIAGMLGGAGEALQKIGATQMQADLDRETRMQTATLESELALQRARTLEELKVQLRDAPLNRLSAKAREYAGQEVPQEAAPVTELSGRGTKPDGTPLETPGIIANARAQIAEVQSWPDSNPDKKPILDQLRRQLATDRADAEAAVAGKTRKRTSEEALGAAVEDAKVNDLPAYAAYEKDVGKPAREERKLDQQAARDEARAAAAGKEADRKERADARRFEAEMRRLDLQAGSLEAQTRKIDAMIEHWERSDANKAEGKGTSQERMYSIINSANQTIRQLNDAGAPRDEKAKQEWMQQKADATRVRDRAMARLNNMLEDGSTPPAPAPAPAAPTGKRPPLSSFMR